QIDIIPVAQQQAIARDEIDEATERRLDGGQILKNISVIEFDVVDNGHLRQVVDELASLIEEGRVVFVPFDDEPLAVGEARSLPQIRGDATDEITWVQSVVLKNPREQGRCRGFAVRARDHERAFAANEMLLEQFRQRTIAQLAL